MKRTLLLFAGALALASEARADGPAATNAPLRVALPPSAPGLAALGPALEARWAAEGRPESLEFLSWDCRAEPFPEDADVVVFDGAFLETFADPAFVFPASKEPAGGRPTGRLALAGDGPRGRPAWMQGGEFLPFAADGGFVRGWMYGVPLAVGTPYAFARKAEGKAPPLDFLLDYEEPSRGDLLHRLASPAPGPAPDPAAPRPDGPGGLLFRMAGDDAELGAFRLLLEGQLASPSDATNVLAGLVRNGGAAQLSRGPADGDPFERADWFKAGLGAWYVDRPEALARLGGADAPFEVARLFRERTPYSVAYASVSLRCPPERLGAARECVRVLASRECLAGAIWPDGGAPRYALPARVDLFRDFASRDAAYAFFFADATRPGNRAVRLPRGAPALLREAADRSRDFFAAPGSPSPALAPGALGPAAADAAAPAADAAGNGASAPATPPDAAR